MVLPATGNYWTLRKINHWASQSISLASKEINGEASRTRGTLLKRKRRKLTTDKSFIWDEKIERTYGGEIVWAQIRNDGCWSSQRIGLNSK